ncbi:polyprenyl synthetase family protein [Rhodovulum sp. DZ06]|uniref:polyprenyl synthetase family protein n=1 Tax=Rhodovulum sp. DZ06 TaxID=3425126 RepID=UPI003D3368C9
MSATDGAPVPGAQDMTADAPRSDAPRSDAPWTAADEAELSARLSEVAQAVEEALDALLPAAGDKVAAAMRHAALGGGKRLRAFLAVEATALCAPQGAPEGADVDAAALRPAALRVAAAVECLHAYSLVHDDLPCMDDDDMRRGLPTVHVKWDEATAVLAGDALQTLAFEILADPATHPDPARRAALCLGLARASGAQGMVLGQALDIAAETAETPLDLASIERLQALKTGALIAFSAEAGAILAEPGGAEDAAPGRAALRRFASHMGLAFQIQDDVLDVTGDAEAAGKAVGKDAEAGKATFVSLLGLPGARALAAEEVARAETALSGFGAAARPLALAARFAISRSK